jgi:hypothetical protein
MTNEIYFFNQIFTLISALAFLSSIWLYVRLKNTCSILVRLSLIGACFLSLLSSFMPALAVVLTVAFVPSFIYHMLNPLLLAPFVVGVVSFFAFWCVLILVREFRSIFSRSTQPPKLSVTLMAFVVFCFMSLSIHNGYQDYKVIFHAQQMARYAPTGTDPKHLEEIYLEVAKVHDSRTFADVAALLALNHNSPPELLTAIYKKTAAANINPINREHIYLSLTKNPNTSSDLLQKLMFSLSESKTLPANSGALTAIPNQGLSQNKLLQLAMYPDCEVRRAVIAYPNISKNVLTQMVSSDPDMGVRRDARQRLGFIRGVTTLEKPGLPQTRPTMLSPRLPEKISNMDNANQLRRIFDATADDEGASVILESLASNCFITEDLARKIYEKAFNLKNYPRTAVLMSLAANPQTPADILNNLTSEKDLAILRALASNPNLPYSAMVVLVPFPDCRIRKEIICIPHTSTVLLKKLRKDKDESVALEANERAAQEDEYLHNCAEVKKLNPSCQKYYSTTSPDVRMYPNTSQAKSLIPAISLDSEL